MSTRVCLYFALFMTTAWSGEAAEVRLRTSAVCTAPVVRLGDIADVVDESDARARWLAALPLAPSPADGSQRTFSRHDVRQLLVLTGVERDQLQITGSDRVTIVAHPDSLVSRPGISAALRSAVQAASHVEPGPQAGASPLPPADSPDEGEPPLALVERGDIVSVVARAASVRVSTSGKALETGALGEMIPVALADTDVKIMARVVGPQAVEAAVPGQKPKKGTPASIAGVPAPSLSKADLP
jgi:Chaperone for flagella basal body P-ring formation